MSSLPAELESVRWRTVQIGLLTLSLAFLSILKGVRERWKFTTSAKHVSLRALKK